MPSFKNRLPALIGSSQRLTWKTLRNLNHLALIVGQLAESQAKLVESQAGATRQMAATDERLNALMTVVERHIQGHNGQP